MPCPNIPLDLTPIHYVKRIKENVQKVTLLVGDLLPQTSEIAYGR